MAIAEVLITGVTRENQKRAQERMRALEKLRNDIDPSTEGRAMGPDI